MDPVKMVDLKSQYLRIRDEINEAIGQVLESTAFIQGPQVEKFAEALAQNQHSKYVITCANGTDALQIALMALEAKPGHEIILPAHTYVATAEVIALLGLTPVWVDVDPESYNIDYGLVEKRITNNTFAIVPVHLYGQCADMEPILELAHKHRLHVIEDAAQALGAEYMFSDGRKMKAGTMGTSGCTSFFPSKNLGCYGDGGAIFTQDDQLAERMNMIANHGQRIKYHHDLVGINSRLDTLQAAILLVKLKYLDEYTRKRNAVAAYYDQELASVPFLQLPIRSKYSTHVFHQYTVVTNGILRDEFKRFLEGKGIPSMIYYPIPLHLQKAYQCEKYPRGSLPVTERFSETVLSLPIHTELREDQLSYICHTIKEFANHGG